MRSYPVSIVGESYYQEAIRKCRAGDRVTFEHEIGNPHDADAVGVYVFGGACIGHLARGDWFREYILDDEGSYQACIARLESSGTQRAIGVVLEVTLMPRDEDFDVDNLLHRLGMDRNAPPAAISDAPPTTPKRSWLQRLFARD